MPAETRQCLRTDRMTSESCKRVVLVGVTNAVGASDAGFGTAGPRGLAAWRAWSGYHTAVRGHIPFSPGRRR